MLARLILFCYVGQYPSPNTARFLQPELEQLSEKGQGGDLMVHAAMYGMGDKYDIPALKKLSRDNYVHTFKNIEYPVSDFIESVPVAFTTTAETDQELRKWVVWEAQKYNVLLWHYADFKDVMNKAPEFVHDLVTKYARGSFVWCDKCKERDVVPLSKHCTCGFSSMCGLSEYCHNPQTLIKRSSCEICGSQRHLKIVDLAVLQDADADTLRVSDRIEPQQQIKFNVA